MPKKIVFLDRDGTINVDYGFVYQIKDWTFTNGAPEALKALKAAGYTLAVVTNQSGAGAGMYTENDVTVIHQHMQKLLAEKQAAVDIIAYCPHAREAGCDCRKPKTGMAKQIEERLGEIDYVNSWMIGDKIADLMFGKTLGTHTAIIRSRYWHQEELPQRPDIIADSLKEAAEKIIEIGN